MLLESGLRPPNRIRVTEDSSRNTQTNSIRTRHTMSAALLLTRVSKANQRRSSSLKDYPPTPFNTIHPPSLSHRSPSSIIYKTKTEARCRCCHPTLLAPPFSCHCAPSSGRIRPSQGPGRKGGVVRDSVFLICTPCAGLHAMGEILPRANFSSKRCRPK